MWMVGWRATSHSQLPGTQVACQHFPALSHPPVQLFQGNRGLPCHPEPTIPGSVKLRLPVPFSRGLRRAALAAEWLWSGLGSAIAWMLPFRRRHSEIEIRVFNALFLPRGLYLQGRILARREFADPRLEDSRWTNFRRLRRDWLSHEIPHAELILKCGGATRHLTADREGYFQLDWPDAPLAAHEDGLHLTSQGAERLVHPSSPAPAGDRRPVCVLLSDIDDTLIETGAVSTRRMIATTLFHNSLTREVVDGMPELLRDLRQRWHAPLFYVTSSPWNLFPLLDRILRRVDAPPGGYFMTDWGITVDHWIHPDHRVHKQAAIRRVLDWYPDLPIVFIGDDSQYDPEIIREFLQREPERIKAVFIRHVGTEHRAQEVRAILGPHNRANRPCRLIASPAEARAALLPLAD